MFLCSVFFLIHNLQNEGNSTASWQFLILDGPVDTLWVENLNSLLDDSKVLCLSNGERINLKNNVRVVFEVDSLVHTSPATVSRCVAIFAMFLLLFIFKS